VTYRFGDEETKRVRVPMWKLLWWQVVDPIEVAWLTVKVWRIKRRILRMRAEAEQLARQR
jgi:hypothetical protein